MRPGKKVRMDNVNQRKTEGYREQERDERLKDVLPIDNTWTATYGKSDVGA